MIQWHAGQTSGQWKEEGAWILISAKIYKHQRSRCAVGARVHACIPADRTRVCIRSLVHPPEHRLFRTRIPPQTSLSNTVWGPNTRTRVLEHTVFARLSHPNTRTQPEHTNTALGGVFSNTAPRTHQNLVPNTAERGPVTIRTQPKHSSNTD